MPAPQHHPTPVDLVYVDLDGTLTPSDSLFESVVAMVRRRPLSALRLPVWAARGRLHLKSRVAESQAFDPADLPYRSELVADLRAWRDEGAELVLATAAHADVAGAVAGHLGLFDSVLSSTTDINLKGAPKLAAIAQHAGGRSFAYVGNEVDDLPILEAADAGFIAGRRAATLRNKVRSGRPIELYEEAGSRFAPFLRLMRPRHWVKNLLVFVPLVTSQQTNRVSEVAAATLALVAFSLVASGNYGLNDVLDIHADRRSPVRAGRPVAAGQISIPAATAFSLVLIGGGLAVAAFLPAGFQISLAAYLGISLAYSLALKRLLLLDVVTLASVFVLRVVAGAEAIGVTTSFWLLAFSLFFFASLALTKRCSELHVLEGSAVSHGRAYRRGDLAVLQTIGSAAGVVSVLVLALYIEDPASAAVYRRPEYLWLLTPLLLYWISRLWIKAGRGEMQQDPVLFAFTDRASWLVGALALAVTLAAG